MSNFTGGCGNGSSSAIIAIIIIIIIIIIVCMLCYAFTYNNNNNTCNNFTNYIGDSGFKSCTGPSGLCQVNNGGMGQSCPGSGPHIMCAIQEAILTNSGKYMMGDFGGCLTKFHKKCIASKDGILGEPLPSGLFADFIVTGPPNSIPVYLPNNLTNINSKPCMITERIGPNSSLYKNNVGHIAGKYNGLNHCTPIFWEYNSIPSNYNKSV